MFWGLRFQTDLKLSKKLDADLYDRDETIELKIPVALPYPVQSHDYQRVEGRFEHQGQFYRLVKNKLQNDTLYVVCIRDQETRKLFDTMKDYVQLAQALPGTSTGHKALNFLSKLVKDFYPQVTVDMPSQGAVTITALTSERPHLFLQPVIPILAPPPRA